MCFRFFNFIPVFALNVVLIGLSIFIAFSNKSVQIIRVYRLSQSGVTDDVLEYSCEINVPSGYGRHPTQREHNDVTARCDLQARGTTRETRFDVQRLVSSIRLYKCSADVCPINCTPSLGSLININGDIK